MLGGHERMFCSEKMEQRCWQWDSGLAMLLSERKTWRGSRNSYAVEGTVPGPARVRFLPHFIDFHSCEISDAARGFHHRHWQVGQKQESRTVSYSDLKTFPFQFMRWVCISFSETSLLLK